MELKAELLKFLEAETLKLIDIYILVRMVMGRELDLIVYFSVNNPAAFITKAVVLWQYNYL